MERTNKQLNEFQMSPEVGDNEPSGALPSGEVDKEGAMAKADLYKLATYSYKLFTKIQDEDQFESWVQAKITKAADYIASVYHYLEYEMKFNEYGHQLDNSDVLSEDQKSVLKNKLMEAKAKIKELKITEAKKSQKAATAKKDYDGDGNIESGKDEYLGSKDKAIKKEKNKSKKMAESSPSDGLSSKKKAEIVKKAKAGEDIGKKGKGFKEVEKAAKKSGAKDPKAVAAAAMWKNIKREAAEESCDETKLDELNLKPWGKKSAFSKKGYNALADRKANDMEKASAEVDAADENGDDAGISSATKNWKDAKKVKDKALVKASLSKNESAEDTEFSAKNVGKAAGNIWQGMKNTANAVGDTIDATKTAVNDFSKGFDAAQNPATTSTSAKPAATRKAVVKESTDLDAIKILSGLK